MKDTQFIGKSSDPFIFHPLLVLRTPRLPLTGKFELDEQFLESIYLASPTLYKETLKQKLGKTEKTGRLDRTLLKYFLRSTNRCTPFALFAGCSIIPWGKEDSTEEIVLNQQKTERFARMDIDFLFKLVDKLTRIKDIKENLVFYKNNSIYIVGDELRYIEFSLENKNRQYQISSVKNSNELTVLLKAAETTGAKLPELLKLLNEYDSDDAIKYISEMVDAQLLVSELQPKLTGGNYLEQIIQTLKKNLLIDNPLVKNHVEVLSSILFKLEGIRLMKHNHITVYKEIAEMVKEFDLAVEETNLFQVDVHKPANGFLGEEIRRKLHGTLIAMNKLSPKISGENFGISKFCNDFEERYGDSKMPLLQVLDPELGIGYDGGTEVYETPLLQLIEKKRQIKNESIRWSKIEQLLLKKMSTSNDNNIEINESDLEGLDADWGSLPASMSVIFKVVDKNKSVLQIESIGGSSASNLLGRFSHINNDVNNILTDIAAWEKKAATGKIVAEIVHQPEDRICNVMIRPASHSYEIPYLAHSSLNNEHQIPTGDLWVSVKNNRVLLWSEKHGKEILPRMSNAHNFKRNDLPVYRFLCDLQNQGERTSLSFNWGSLHKIYKEFPRVLYNGSILAPAQWILTKDDLLSLAQSKNIEETRLKLRIPKQVLICEGDNQLLIDFNHQPSIEIFISEIKGKKQILLKEHISQENGGIIDQLGNNYANEYICTVLNNNKAVQYNTQIKKVENRQEVKREFIFGSEWNYYKIYCGKKAADKILTEAIKPLTQELLNLGIIDKWFFIRYNDPAFHLRLRFRLTDINKIGNLIGSVNRYLAFFLTSGHIWRLQTETYSRELERYGSENMEMTESLFYIDSTAFLDMLDFSTDQDIEKTRWLYVVKSIDHVLSCFLLDAERKEKLLYVLRESFVKEHQLDKKMGFQLDTTYRKWKADVWQIMDKRNQNYCLNQAINTYASYDSVTGALAKGIIDNNKNIERFLHSLIHMMVNRAMVTEHRLHELVIYHFLYQYYHSTNTMGKKTTSNFKKLHPVS